MIPVAERDFELFEGVRETYRSFRDLDSEGLSKLPDFLASLEDSGETIVGVTVFSSERSDSSALEARLRGRFPVSFVLGRGNGRADVQVNSMEITDPRIAVKRLSSGGIRIGTVVEHPSARILSLEGMRFETGDAETQFDAFYAEAFRRFSENGFDFGRHTVKSWNSLRNVLSNYAAFNRARNRAFASIGLESGYPAGTGIDCLLSGNAEMVSALYAVAPVGEGDIVLRSVKSAKQCEAESYGPKFSRAKVLEVPLRWKKVFVSGTASVGANGETLNSNDIVANVRHTMATVGDILTAEGLGWGDVLQSFVYVKKPEFFPVFKEFAATALKDSPVPYVHNVCDVCRDDWLFEFECVAGKRE